MADSPRFSSSADHYPPYNALSYQENNASSDFLGGREHLGYQNNDSSAFLSGGGGQPSTRTAPYGDKYSDGYDGPPEAMLQQHANAGRKRAAATGIMAPKNRKWLIAGGLGLLAVAIAAVVGGIIASKKSSSSTSDARNDPLGAAGASATSGSNSAEAVQNSALMGGNGSTIIDEQGNQFTYINNFGGYWSSVPFDDSARPNSWTPALNESWDYTVNKIYGVNIGGWLVLEPFIVPGAFEPYENDTEPAVDEYTLMQKLGDNATAFMTDHYENFITEQDFAEIAGAGLSWVRIAMPFWAIETIEGEPFVEGLAWKYLLKGLAWARKYGLRVNLDLHTIPGSQNAWNHSGRLGVLNFLNGTNAIYNAERALNYIRTLTEFIAQPEYQNLVPMFSIINEPRVDIIGNQTIREFYLEAYTMIRSITGTGEGHGPWISFHDGFQGFGTWAGFLPGCDRCAMDQHNYMAFATPNNDSVSYDSAKPCAFWANQFYMSQQNFGLSYSGEWALDINDCGVYLNNVGNGARYDGTYIAPGATTPLFPAVGDCTPWNEWWNWSDNLKQQYQQVAYGHMDALQNWFFWTWTIGNSVKTGRPPNPMWNMKLGLKEGYFPTDPRQGNGVCKTYLAQQGFAALPATATFSSFPSAWMTGGAGAGTIPADQTQSYGTWPPQSVVTLGTVATNFPVYTKTGTPITLSATTPTAYPSGATTVKPGNGWAVQSDNTPAYTPIAGCTYPLPYDGVYAPVPEARCTGA